MQLLSLSALSAFVIASAGLVNAIPAAHNADIVQRAASSHRRAIAPNVAVAAKPRAAAVVPPTLQNKHRRGKRSQKKEKRCRIRPTSSTSSFANATVTSTQVGEPTTTATIDGSDDSFHHSSSSASPTPTGSYNSNWQLTVTRQGSSFFDNWDFWSYADPTHGNVQYLSRDDGRNQGLWGVGDDGVAYMKVSTASNPANGNRPSIRIHDQYTWGVGTLVIMDAKHMPTGCAVWGAFWANGPNWPAGGEIDIVEGVHDDTQNKGTLHTADGCYASTDGNVPSPSGQLSHASCGSSGADNTGCGFTDTTNDNSYGAPFNQNGGGVFAMRLDDNGISMWFFPRGSVPDDIVAEQPMPESWPAPYGSWSSNSCPTRNYFYDQIAIFDTTLCGDWAGNTWRDSGCQDKTGFSSCSDFVAQMGSAFGEAYWLVNYVKYFQQ